MINNSTRWYVVPAGATRNDARKLQAELFPIEEHGPDGPGLTLPAICLDARMSVNGAADPWEGEFIERVRSMLMATAATWEPSRKGDEVIDNAVLAMINAAIDLLSREQIDRLPPDIGPPD